MLSILANTFFFLLGIHLAMQLIADLYRIIDLWYRIEDFLFPVVRSILLWILIISLTGWYLEGSNERAFIWGCLFFSGFHVGIFWIFQALIRLKKWQKEWRE